MVAMQHGAFVGGRGVAYVHLEEEAVELRFGERVGALLFHRVLRRQNMERFGQGVLDAADGDLMLLHGLQQGGLGAWAGAVDFVGHEQLAEHRAGDEAEIAAAGGTLLEHFAAGDVGGHQVGGELHALAAEA